MEMVKTFRCEIFFVTDKFKKGEVKVAFCPMHYMLGDFFMKPLQGTLFVCMREKILNLRSSTSTTVHRSALGKEKTREKVNNERKEGVK